MQYDSETSFTVHYKAVSLPQPDADRIAFGKVDHQLMKVSTKYRGELLIVSKPNKRKDRSGMMVGKADLVDCKKVEGGYLWKFSNPRRVIEMPCQKSTMRGTIWDCYYTDGEIIEYPIGVRQFLNMPKFK